MSDVAGQSQGRFALEIAAAGGHHMLLTGPPGSGKTMLAERLPSILPTLDNDAAMEVTAIRSLCSAGEHLSELVRQPPFEAPHHSASAPAFWAAAAAFPARAVCLKRTAACSFWTRRRSSNARCLIRSVSPWSRGP